MSTSCSRGRGRRRARTPPRQGARRGSSGTRVPRTRGGERLLAHQDARAGVGQLAREPGVVLVRMGDEHGRARGVHPEAHERAHKARVVVVVGGARVDDEHVVAVAHHVNVDGRQERPLHEQLDAPDLGFVAHADAGEAVRVERKALRLGDRPANTYVSLARHRRAPFGIQENPLSALRAPASG